MSRDTLRTLFTVLVLALALAAPSQAAGTRGGDPGAPTDIVPRWIVDLFEKIWLEIAPPGGDGSAVTTNGDGGDVGLHIDPTG